MRDERGREGDERAFMGPPYRSRCGRDNEVYGKSTRLLPVLPTTSGFSCSLPQE